MPHYYLLAEIGILLLLFEVGLIFAGIGKNNGVFDDMMYAVIVFVVALTTLLGPVLLRVMIKEES